MFDETPKVGDKIRVTGKVKEINDDTGEVEVTYDDVNIVKKKRKSRNNDDDDNDTDMENMPAETMPEFQTYDQALSRAFPNTQ